MYFGWWEDSIPVGVPPLLPRNIAMSSAVAPAPVSISGAVALDAKLSGSWWSIRIDAVGSVRAIRSADDTSSTTTNSGFTSVGRVAGSIPNASSSDCAVRATPSGVQTVPTPSSSRNPIALPRVSPSAC